MFMKILLFLLRLWAHASNEQRSSNGNYLSDQPKTSQLFFHTYIIWSTRTDCEHTRSTQNVKMHFGSCQSAIWSRKLHVVCDACRTLNFALAPVHAQTLGCSNSQSPNKRCTHTILNAKPKWKQDKLNWRVYDGYVKNESIPLTRRTEENRVAFVHGAHEPRPTTVSMACALWR